MALVAGASVTPHIRLVRLLGEGGMGSVWVARHEKLAIDVAVKLIADDLLEDGDPIVRARFSREAQLAAKLDSPHVVRVLDHGETDEATPYIVMELLRGETLAERIRRTGRLSGSSALRVVREIAAGLAHAHRHGVVHRDIKPQNVFFADQADGSTLVKILDFGIARSTRTAEAAPAATQSGRSSERLLT